MIRHNKKSLCLSKEARKNGTDPILAHSRFQRGWDIEEAIKVPADTAYLPPEKRVIKTKEEGQWFLDETPYGKLPKEIQKAIPHTSRQLKFGKIIRRHNNAVFLKWYESKFKNS